MCSIIRNVENFKIKNARWLFTIDKIKKDREEIKLDTNYLENNYLTLVGKVTGEKDLVMKFMEKDFMYLT